MRIQWTVPAAADLEGIKNDLQENYPQFAEPTVLTIYRRIRALKTSPNRGTRELVLSPLPYIVVYRVTGQAVSILHIHHGAQDWR